MSTDPSSTKSAAAPHDCGCPDFTRAGVSRRSLFKTAAALSGGVVMTQMFGESMLQASFAGSAGAGGNTLVVLSLRGGIDGLGVVVPHGDAGYYSARPNTAIPAASLICADSSFGLHPKMAPLAKFWTSGELAAVQAVGLPVPNRSHFSAIEAVEDAAPGSSARSGWINRMIGLSSSHTDPRCLDAVQLGMDFPTTAISGDAPTLSATSVKGLQLTGVDSPYSQSRYGSMNTMWGGNDGPLSEGVRDALSISQGPGSALNLVASRATAVYPTATNAAPFSAPLQSAAALIRADLGTEVIAIDAGSWDFHSGYGSLSSGSMVSTVDGLAQSLGAFLDDLGPLRSRVTVATISEFGRRVSENGSQGFDHGWGNMMLLVGAGVKGGRYYGTWPGLNPSALADGDLKVTTDYRNILGEIVTRRFVGRSLAETFPGLSYAPLGLMS